MLNNMPCHCTPFSVCLSTPSIKALLWCVHTQARALALSVSLTPFSHLSPCSEADALLGTTIDPTADSTAAAAAFLRPLVKNADALATLLGTSSSGSQPSYAFQPVCPPVCLNLGSFAMFMRSSSCICGAAKLASVQQAAREGTRVAITSLAGAAAMYVASTALLMILTAHYVEAKFDR